MNVAGMILGIVAFLFAFVPLVGTWIAIPCAVIGLPLSGVSFAKKRKAGEGTGMAIAGIVTCVLAIIIAILWFVIVVIGIASS